MTIIKSRGCTLTEVGVQHAPKRCPGCSRRVGTRFVALYTGTPADKTLIGWRCVRCGYQSSVLDGE